ncbi:hypothetical protein METBIDRAFT_34952 [Metschnikowia bicuspidata var. bicuspidata NRRL YB-4993]|uniref:Uncharacterized protein n=1 Tax=Metschnikowia bicuspidata var. bicuspidata NRRL YB-4993 TaxID=869754 RepID=A0A1A0HJX5_9ASCO|nr:hypothetical protein METBIDRAFT_34952 [Metschnikowia bicuspidata var. bicuspidata NRRL YB-4993]OBA24479.1 hypothetical protein METBIDRAFT_34952 [Metschnikowia bicuspidata var. bicuspidata NRRL YB-4993]
MCIEKPSKTQITAGRLSGPAASENPNLHPPGSQPLLQPGQIPPLRRKKPSGADPFIELYVKRDCSELSLDVAQTQPFWKFHVLKFGHCLYLTTNPTLRHLHCRNAPGYFVQVCDGPCGFSMIFEDISTGEELVKIDKLTDRCSNQFMFHVRKNRHVKDGRFQKSTRNGNAESRALEPIPQELLPATPTTPMLSYSSQMIDGLLWSVGSLPQYRESRIKSQEIKYIAKKNVYFHRCFGDISRYPEYDVPPAMAVFRECESGSRKRAMRQLNRFLQAGHELSSKLLKLPPANVSPYAEITLYYKGGDGVYFDKVPADDEPDHHHKLGWVTVYDDPHVFSKQGMFDLVVALTTAIGYERNLAFEASNSNSS